LQLLRAMGQRREGRLRRPPEWCMDLTVGGSALFPPRLLEDEWFTENELVTLRFLEAGLAQTGHGAGLARDILALKIYDINVHIILDDSSSMGASMFGSKDSPGGGWTQSRITKVFADRAFAPNSAQDFANCPLGASSSRWAFAQEALEQWDLLFGVLGLHPQLRRAGSERTAGAAGELFGQPPSGHASVSDALRQVLQEEGRPCGTRLILVLTDGEAVDRADFNAILDEIEDGVHGDTQVCLLGLNLEPQGLEWFEDAECEASRVRTIRPWEVEQQQMLWRKVIEHPGQYSFAFHTVRALLTNLFPAEYDYKAPFQCLRHRLYSTLRALDRRITGTRDAAYMAFGSDACIVPVVEGFRSLVGAAPRSPSGPPPSEAALEAAAVQELCSKTLWQLFTALRPMPGEAPSRHVDRGTLSLVQQALAVLQPGEMVCHDLKFSDPSRNIRALRRAVGYLKRAAEGRWR